MVCSACGYQISGNERLCPGCGAVLPPAPGKTGTNAPDAAGKGLGSLVRQGAGEVEKWRAEIKAVQEAIENAKKDAVLKEAAAKEAIAKEKVARDEAIKAIKEATLKDAEARKASDMENAAAEEIRKAVDDFDKAMKEAAHRTASKGAYLERGEANSALAKANEAREAAEQAAADAANKTAEAKKAAELINQMIAKEAAAKRAVEQAIAQEAAAKRAAEQAAAQEASARRAAESEASIRNLAAERAARERAEQEAAARQKAEEAAARKAAEPAAKKEAGTAVAQSTAEESAAKNETKGDGTRRQGEAAEASPASARPSFRYKINEGAFPSVSIMLDEAQSIFTQSDVMVWMSAGMALKNEGNGDLSTATYSSQSGWQEICIASRFPGEIWCLDMAVGSVIVQKGSFLAAQASVSLSEHVSMQMGGEKTKASFVFQRLSGEGIALIAIGGSLIERMLRPNETIKAHIANIAALEERVSFQTQIIPDIKKGGGEGRILSTLTGPGRVWLQTLPAYASS